MRGSSRSPHVGALAASGESEERARLLDEEREVPLVERIQPVLVDVLHLGAEPFLPARGADLAQDLLSDGPRNRRPRQTLLGSLAAAARDDRHRTLLPLRCGGLR